MDHAEIALIKAHEDAVIKLLETVPRVQQLVLLRYLPLVLGLRPGADINYEIVNELRKTSAP